VDQDRRRNLPQGQVAENPGAVRQQERRRRMPAPPPQYFG